MSETNETLPKTLTEAVRYVADPEVCVRFVSDLRWKDGIVCPHCESKEAFTYLKTRRIWKCMACRKQFSPKSGTIFEDSPLPLDKWLIVTWMLANCKNGVSSMEVHRAIGVTQKTAWFMLQRIRLAMQEPGTTPLSGTVEADETFIGGKARNMHAHVREQKIQGRRTVGKSIVVGMLERGGKVKTVVAKTRRKKSIQKIVRDHVAHGSELHTDALKSDDGLLGDYIHKVIDHAQEYVNGHVYTNGMENFWSLLKRTLKGTYVAVEPFHLFRYLDEQSFRFNERKDCDSGRFHKVVRGVTGKQLTYTEVTGTK
ncbi:MAG: IS1595 family transposase [Bryobacterales bacterium]|nr:IS1595 family transposase [Bryobacterales bacterium]